MANQTSITINQLCHPINVSGQSNPISVTSGSQPISVSKADEAISVVNGSINQINAVNQPIQVNVAINSNPVQITQGQSITINTGDVSAIRYDFTAGEDIQAYDVVVAFGDMVYRASAAIPNHATNVTGIATSAALTGQSVSITTHGRVVNNGFSFDSTKLIFLDTNPGQIIQDDIEGLSGAAFTIQLGVVRSSTTIDLKIQQPILF